MTARTHTDSDMREAFVMGFDAARANPRWDGYAAASEALTLWPDPAPEPPAMTVREEPDPDPNNAGIFWRWTPDDALEYYHPETERWDYPGRSWFVGQYVPARFALWADLAAFPNRLPDGRPCTLKGEAKP